MLEKSKRKQDPEQAIAEILRGAVRSILALVRSEQALSLDRLDQAITSGTLTAGDGEASRHAPRRKPQVQTVDVAEELRRIFASAQSGLHLADLRARTGFGNMQLHRGLKLLLASGEVIKRGRDRKTEYLRSRPAPKTRRTGRARGKARKPRR
ncbi:MAG: hypothetical protein RBU30_07585 [Polyangia bacterium]|jgi:hypothetical protein|nr:hypothetical protein [Polyangia bacterium]